MWDYLYSSDAGRAFLKLGVVRQRIIIIVWEEEMQNH